LSFIASLPSTIALAVWLVLDAPRMLQPMVIADWPPR
jgi:hypothetical protein